MSIKSKDPTFYGENFLKNGNIICYILSFTELPGVTAITAVCTNCVFPCSPPELPAEVWLHEHPAPQWLSVHGVHRQGFEEDAEADGAGGDRTAGQAHPGSHETSSLWGS